MDRYQLIQAFASLAERMQDYPQLDELFQEAKAHNPWFVVESQQYAWNQWIGLMSLSNLEQWLYSYPITNAVKQIGVIAAGNIPLVCWHDVLAVLLSGHKLSLKMSADDSVLPRFLIEQLNLIDDYFKEAIVLVDRMSHVDAVIATGSNNSLKYFEYYFSRVPHVLRGNRVGIAVLSGFETQQELILLGEDLFRYFGMGCRNVNHLFIPNEFEFEPLMQAVEPWRWIVDNNKYANNYDYQRAHLLLDLQPHLDNGFALWRRWDALASPVSTIHFSYYDTIQQVRDRIINERNSIQVVVSHKAWFEGSVPFGQGQQPSLADYADGVDTLAFLTSL